VGAQMDRPFSPQAKGCEYNYVQMANDFFSLADPRTRVGQGARPCGCSTQHVC